MAAKKPAVAAKKPNAPKKPAVAAKAPDEINPAGTAEVAEVVKEVKEVTPVEDAAAVAELEKLKGAEAARASRNKEIEAMHQARKAVIAARRKQTVGTRIDKARNARALGINSAMGKFLRKNEETKGR